MWDLPRSAHPRRSGRQRERRDRAAQAGAEVVASDITLENLEAGRKEAEALGVALEWVEADAQALPFGEDEFDVVTSSFGAIFAPDHQKVANELLRVCRPGGTIGLTTFPPGGLAEDIFGVVAPYMPPSPPDAASPLLWGVEDHVRQLFGDRVESLEMNERMYTEINPLPVKRIGMADSNSLGVERSGAPRAAAHTPALPLAPKRWRVRAALRRLAARPEPS